jgi:nitric oxide reductase NorD protein
MAEPEALLADGAQRAAVAVRELWRRARPARSGERALADVRRRLDLFLAALYEDPPAIVASDPPPAPTWLARAFGRAPRHLVERTALAATDGASIRLPRTLPGGDGADITYRLLAVEQAARAARGTPECLTGDRLERDLALLAESVAVDRLIVQTWPGLAPDLRAARATALAGRPAAALTALERAVEARVQDVLAADPLVPPPSVPITATPAASLDWARTEAAALRASAGGYRGIAAVPPWGTVLSPPASGASRGAGEETAPSMRAVRSASLRRRPRERRGTDDDDDRPGTWIVRADDAMESVEDPMGLSRPADRDDDADPAPFADALSELPEARVVTTPGTPREVLDTDAPSARTPSESPSRAEEGGVVYPEWDHRLAAYRTRGAVVRPGRMPAGSDAWVDTVMSRHAALVRRVRRRFDGLRPRRVSRGRQPDGAEIDLGAYVDTVADWRAGAGGDDRFYRAAHPARRDLAIALLVDVSASTDSWIGGTLRVIDVEKESLVVLLEALDALGDRHAAYAFSGEGPGAVRVATIKDFTERTGAETRRRVAALEPDGYTRAGAAIRHASAQLARQAGRHHLLLVLSDGKPNDVDVYGGRYGIEDMRQAVAEARLQGIVPFCLTVDREAPTYMPRIFGRGGFALLRRQDLLPSVLVEVVRRLLAG